MNNAKMWLVVSPNVGVPIFLGAVAVGSFAVHVAVVSNTTWVADFLKGQEMGSGAEASASLIAPQTDTKKASYALPMNNGGIEVTITLPDGTTTKAILNPDEAMALSASASPPSVLR